jgi:tetratricopeptide (TPR) repeat protein
MQNQKTDSKNNANNIQIERLDLRLPGSKSDEAIANLSETIDQNPKDAKAYFRRGMVYSNLVNYGKLILAFNEGLDELDAENAIAHDYKDTVQLLEGYCDAALRDFTKAIQLGLVDAAVYECRGNMHLQKGKCDKAMAYYAQAAELGSGYIDAYEGPPLGAPLGPPLGPPLGAPLGAPLGPPLGPAPGPVPASALGPAPGSALSPVPAPAPASALGPF